MTRTAWAFASVGSCFAGAAGDRSWIARLMNPSTGSDPRVSRGRGGQRECSRQDHIRGMDIRVFGVAAGEAPEGVSPGPVAFVLESAGPAGAAAVSGVDEDESTSAPR